MYAFSLDLYFSYQVGFDSRGFYIPLLMLASDGQLPLALIPLTPVGGWLFGVPRRQKRKTGGERGRQKGRAGQPGSGAGHLPIMLRLSVLPGIFLLSFSRTQKRTAGPCFLLATAAREAWRKRWNLLSSSVHWRTFYIDTLLYGRHNREAHASAVDGRLNSTIHIWPDMYFP